MAYNNRYDIRASFVMMFIGLLDLFLIKSQVSTTPIPGAGGMQRISPATLPVLTGIGLVITGLLLYLVSRASLKKAKESGKKTDVSTAEQADYSLSQSLYGWLAIFVYIFLVPRIGFVETSVMVISGLYIYIFHLYKTTSTGLFSNVAMVCFIGAFIFPLFLWYMFNAMLYVRLPAGILTKLIPLHYF